MVSHVFVENMVNFSLPTLEEIPYCVSYVQELSSISLLETKAKPI